MIKVAFFIAAPFHYAIFQSSSVYNFRTFTAKPMASSSCPGRGPKRRLSPAPHRSAFYFAAGGQADDAALTSGFSMSKLAFI
jgi:hypothetical protein